MTQRRVPSKTRPLANGWKKQARIATTANHALTGLTAIDGITPVAGDRILVWQNTAASENGIYEAASGAWTRAWDAAFDAGSGPGTTLASGLVVFVTEGTLFGQKPFVLTTLDPIGFGNNLVFELLGAPKPTRIIYSAPVNTSFAKANYVLQGYTRWDVECVGPGGGGGSGRKGALSSERFGGDGGAGGGKSRGGGLLADLAASVQVDVDAGSAGGAAVTTSDTNGNAGAAGSNGTSWYYGQDYAVRAMYGASGAGGGTAPSTVQALGGMGNIPGMPGGTTSASTTQQQYYGGTISYPYSSVETAPGTPIVSSSRQIGSFAGGGGGAGGGMNTADTFVGSGGDGGLGSSEWNGNNVAAGGTAPGGVGGAGLSTGANNATGGSGGGGGAARAAGGGGGAGGVGGSYGGGGGGGGAAVNTVGDSGAGGAGGPGVMILILS